MKNYVKPGNTLTFVAVAAVLSGEGVLLGDGGLFGVSAYDVKEGEEGEATIQGVFGLPKAAGIEVAAFEPAYFVADTKAVTNVAGSNARIGYFVADAASAEGQAPVLLVPQFVQAEEEPAG